MCPQLQTSSSVYCTQLGEHQCEFPVPGQRALHHRFRASGFICDRAGSQVWIQDKILSVLNLATRPVALCSLLPQSCRSLNHEAPWFLMCLIITGRETMKGRNLLQGHRKVQSPNRSAVISLRPVIVPRPQPPP